MGKDLCVPCGDGIINIRVGAVIVKNGSILMVGNEASVYYYSVGGRIQFGETAEEAVVREVFEETGVRLAVDRLAFVHECHFYGDSQASLGKLVYEISFYFLMDVPADFEPVCRSITETGESESLYWVTPDTPRKLYPDFFRTEALSPPPDIRHYYTDDRL